MAYGLPIVTTPVFGIREQVKPGVNALFYEPGDIAELSQAIAMLVRDADMRLRFAGNARAVLATLTSFEEMVARYGEIFLEAAETEPLSRTGGAPVARPEGAPVSPGKAEPERMLDQV